MKKFSYLFVSIILILIVIVWKLYLENYLSNFYQIYEWGIYLFSIPIAYFFVVFLLKSKQSSLKIIATVFWGALIPILLAGNFLLEKILMTLAGAIITWTVMKITKSNRDS